MRIWRSLRRLTGDDAYERYLTHRRMHQEDDTPLLTRSEFVRREQQRRWEGVRRCC